jgi:uncharacterized membrane protein YhhN
MTFSRPLLFVSAAASLIFLFANSLATGDWLVVFKVASIAILAVLASPFNRLLAIALALGALGDFFLGVRRLGSLDAEKLFLFGLGSFLAGHLVYIAMFRRCRTNIGSRHGKPSLRSTRTVAITVILIALVAVLGALRNSLGPLLIPVVVYAIVLAGMAISAQLAELGNSLAAIGALCFVASDAMLAIHKFSGPFIGSGLLIWITYYLAQLLIFLGVTRRAGRIS